MYEAPQVLRLPNPQPSTPRTPSSASPPAPLPSVGIKLSSLGKSVHASPTAASKGGCSQVFRIGPSPHVCVCVCVCVAQLCLTLCDPTDCNPPGSFVPGAFQARIHAGSENPSWSSWEEAALVQAEVSARRWRWGLEAWCERWMGAGSVQTLSVECNSSSRQF